MKFQVSSGKLFAQLQAISRIIPSKSTLPILENVLFDLNGLDLTLTASDSETAIKTKLAVDSAEGKGKVAFAAKLLIDILKEFPEQPLTFDIDDNNFGLNILSASGTYSLVGANGAEYPEMDMNVADENNFSIAAPVLLGAINKTISCTTEDELRPVMNGIFFDMSEDCATVVATDAHRLVRYKNFTVKSSSAISFILPKKPALLLRNVLVKEDSDIVVAFDQKNITFMFGDTVIRSRQIEGRFPNYNAVIPQNNPFKVTVERQSLLNAARRVSVFANAGTGLIKLALSNNQLNISAQDIDFSTSADESIVCAYEGNPMNIGFKAAFLIDILNTLQSTNVIIELADPARPGLVLPMETEDSEDVVMLLMPMMLND